MKFFLIIILAFLGAVIFLQANYQIAPTDLQAAIVWNLALVLAPALALLFQWKIAKERRVPTALFLITLAVMNCALVLGARAGAWNANDWLQILSGGGLPEHPGKTILGGVVLAIILFLGLRRWWRIPFHVADILIIGFPLASAMVRIGCLYAGCCFGTPSNGSGICYGPGTPAHIQQVKAGLIPSDATLSLAVYPIQLFLILGSLFIFGILWHYRKSLNRPGALFFLGFFLLTAQRFGIEFFREVATNRGELGLMWGGLKMAQWLCLILSIGALLGFLKVQFGKSIMETQIPVASIGKQIFVLACLAAGVFLLQPLLTLDEKMILLVSCLPAIVAMIRRLRQDYQLGEKILAPAMMLSVSTLVLFVSPIDSIGPGENAPTKRQWIEVGAGGITGNYRDISRDCDGNIVRNDKVKYSSGSLDINSNWQKSDFRSTVGIRGAKGSASSIAGHEHKYSYYSYGLYGSISSKVIGISLGTFNRNRDFFDGEKDQRWFPSGSLRIGRLSRYSFDFRAFDDPIVGISTEPIVSVGLVNWGFRDPTESRSIRFGFAVTQNGESGLNLSGRFPLGNSLSGNIGATLVGTVNMVAVGLRYQSPGKRRK